MFVKIKEKISLLQIELNYIAQRWQNRSSLPVIDSGDRKILNALKRDCIYITNLTDLGFGYTPELLNAADILLPSMVNTNYSYSEKIPPKIYTVTDLAEFSNWGREPRLLNLIENYMGVPIAYHGVHLRKDFANKDQFATLLWHRDIEDRRVIKVIVYLNDVEEKHGPFEYVPLSYTSLYNPNYYRIKSKINTSEGINDETLNQIILKSAWKSCPGAAGTVIIVDTRRLLHHGTIRTQERSTLFFAYTTKSPKQPQLCNHFWDDSYFKPNLYSESVQEENDHVLSVGKN
ncbi:phytanoyl-CoA dioxygenase [Anabaena sp. UHCC 0253]|uniref:phytanoyl-CoA dioxygenase n=1 Tax=Anabaena sp. UHCC 0253 TaxID=2590019 RepID=UPI001445C577|nr:phytanoyl-CoA dioxygenase [Anabaena sp. UHCC 0253]MTJ55039.1 phytanoyl-CoA dioxygenase [Anabaena sp. UHCC 0253]